MVAVAGVAIVTALASRDTFAQPQGTPPQGISAKPLTLSGCVQPGDTEEQTVLVDVPSGANNGTKYLLNGTEVKRWIGKRVSVIGGLVPSANVAAQAGAIDPTQAAIAAQPSGGTRGTGTVVLEFHVRKVVPLKGDCPPQ